MRATHPPHRHPHCHPHRHLHRVADPRLAAHSHAQKGVSLKLPEATALVDAIMHGRVHKDFVYVAGQQCEWVRVRVRVRARARARVGVRPHSQAAARHATSGHVPQHQRQPLRCPAADLITTVTENLTLTLPLTLRQISSPPSPRTPTSAGAPPAPPWRAWPS